MTKAQPTDLKASLDAFAKEIKATQTTAFWYRLPVELRETIENSDHATHTIVKWLQANGYPDATYSKIEHYRRASKQPSAD
jgi:hypothetical protein